METNNREYTIELLQPSTGYMIYHKVVQEGYKIKSYSFDVSETSITVPQQGGQFKVAVTSTFLDNEGNDNPIGFTVGKVTGATYDISGNEVTFSIPANTQNSDKKSFSVVLTQNDSGKTKTINFGTQAGIKIYTLLVSPNPVVFGPEGGRKQLDIISYYTYNGSDNRVPRTVAKVRGSDKIHNEDDIIVAYRNDYSDKSAIFRVTQDESGKYVDLEVSMAAKANNVTNLLITGLSAEPTFNSDPVNISYGTIAYYANGDRKEVGPSTTGSLSIPDGSCGNGKLVISENTTDSDRSIVVSISFGGFTKKITLLQKKTEWVLEVSPTSISLGSKESTSFNVTSTKNGVYYDDWKIKNISQLPSWLEAPVEVSKRNGVSTQSIYRKD